MLKILIPLPQRQPESFYLCQDTVISSYSFWCNTSSPGPGAATPRTPFCRGVMLWDDEWHLWMGNHRASVLILMAYIGNSTNFRKSLSIFNSWSFKPSYSMMFCPKYHGQTPGDLLHQTDITLQNSTNSRLPFHKTHGHQFFLYLFKTLMEAIKIWST